MKRTQRLWEDADLELLRKLYLEGFDVEEIGARMHRPVSTVADALHRYSLSASAIYRRRHAIALHKRKMARGGA
jgi:GcrA cell cycle regulator.